jgi:hypothetical protein
MTFETGGCKPRCLHQKVRFVRSLRLEDMTMKDSKALRLDYLASVRDPERAASLFAVDGVFELPFLRSLGVEPRYTGRREITALVRRLLDLSQTQTARAEPWALSAGLIPINRSMT